MYNKVLTHSVTNQMKLLKSFQNFIGFTDKSSFVESGTTWVIKTLASLIATKICSSRQVI